MAQPPGFVYPQFPDHVCLLKRSLYGLKQAPRVWFSRLSGFLLQHGFSSSKADSSMFFIHHGTDLVILLIYVDDIIITGSSPLLINQVLTHLRSEFPVQDVQPLRYFLGIQVERKPNGIFIHQQKYLHDLLVKTGMQDAKGCLTPMATTL